MLVMGQSVQERSPQARAGQWRGSEEEFEKRKLRWQKAGFEHQGQLHLLTSGASVGKLRLKGPPRSVG